MKGAKVYNNLLLFFFNTSTFRGCHYDAGGAGPTRYTDNRLTKQ